ncbi:MAG: response regulator transcription factor [Gammaproteobacteria bacterium]
MNVAKSLNPSRHEDTVHSGKQRVLVVEDDPIVGDGLVAALKEEGYDTDWLQSGATASEHALKNNYAAAILDINLPGQSGFDVLRQIREKDRGLPIVMLSARDSRDDRVVSLDEGADDYVTKPFDLDELLARLRAIRRRAGVLGEAPLAHGELTVDRAAHTATWRGSPVSLSRREFALLQMLLENLGRAITREQLEARIYPAHRAIESNAVEVHIHSLRRKLAPEFIRTVRGIGYIIDRET